MEKPKKRCAHCHQQFVCKRNPQQRYCAEHACQNARKRDWRKQKRADDLDYRVNQRRVHQQWQQRHPDYWRRYRNDHPEYTQANREQQRRRDQLRAQKGTSSKASHLAKSDALRGTKTVAEAVTSGFYRLIPVTRRDLAKSDALTVEICVVTRS